MEKPLKRAILVGDLVYLRPLEREDIDNGWHDWINDHVIREKLDGVFPVPHDELVRYFEKQVPPEAVAFAICHKETGEYIGNGRLGSIDWINRRCTYGRLMGPADYRGEGLGSEALFL